jgi:peptidoglycan/xylan/chitin deacetylase (PgdA/CDA1 family)
MGASGHRAEPDGSEQRLHSVPIATDGLSLALSVDDVRPEQGFGGDRERGPLSYLLRLHEEFGCKATLFVPSDWQGRFALQEHLDWLSWLLEQPCFEVACHGHLHAVEPGSGDPGEFRDIDAETAQARIRQSLHVFAEAGHRPLGFKAPGWFLETSAYAVLNRHFSYVADRVIGTEVSRHPFPPAA